MTESDLVRLVKSASKKMRADDNTKGTAKYLEHFSWLLFLKVYEGVEGERELLAAIDGRTYDRIITGENRWSEWTTSGLTGEQLVGFITGRLFPYLRSLAGTPEGEKVAEVFRGVTTVMKSGYVLAEVIEVINQVDFRGAEDYHAMSVIYETLLAQMGADAGWSGEYYTPRPIVEFMTELTDPGLEDTIYDPCAGSCGFLVAAYERVKPLAETVATQERIQCCLTYGQEAGELPFLLGTMNLMLHGLGNPNLKRRNTLEEDIRSIAPADQHDVVLTNPPFGGSENPQVQENFPLKSSSTQLLFMQHIAAKLRKSGRLGVVLPESFMSNGGVFATFRRRLLTDRNVHTVVSLPAKGIWYKGVKTVLVFADGEGPTTQVQFVEVVPPNGQKNFTKRKPLSRAVLQPYLAIIRERLVTEHSWIAGLDELAARDYDLRPARPLPDPALSVRDAEARIRTMITIAPPLTDSLAKLSAVVERAGMGGVASEAPSVRLGDVLTQQRQRITVRDDESYKRVRVSLHGKGLFLRDVVLGAELKTKTQYVVRAGQFLVAEIDAKLGGMGLVPPELDGAIVSSHYFAFDLDTAKCAPGWLEIICRAEHLLPQIAAKGATNYASIRPEDVLVLEIPLPDPERQRRLIEIGGQAAQIQLHARAMASDAEMIVADVRRGILAGMLEET